MVNYSNPNMILILADFCKNPHALLKSYRFLYQWFASSTFFVILNRVLRYRLMMLWFKRYWILLIVLTTNYTWCFLFVDKVWVFTMDRNLKKFCVDWHNPWNLSLDIATKLNFILAKNREKFWFNVYLESFAMCHLTVIFDELSDYLIVAVRTELSMYCPINE